MELHTRATENFARQVEANPYPGRGLVVGRDDFGDFVLVYWIMGRSENSRNRRFVADAGTLRTEPVDPAKVEDPSLIIYEAMLELPGVQVASNGDQTRTIADALAGGGTFEGALSTREREPDAPNYTPRISGMIDLRAAKPSIGLSILKASPFDPSQTDRFYYRPALPPPGYGLGLTTYASDGSPLPSFSGEPLMLPCAGTPEEIRDRYWSSLNAENRVALAVKAVHEDGRMKALLIENRH